MSSRHFDTTLELPQVLVLEAWEIYLAKSPSAPSVQDFTGWVKQNEPEVLNVLSERTFTSIAEDIVSGRLSVPSTTHG